MIKRLKAWLANIVKTELQKVENDAAGLYSHTSVELAGAREEFWKAARALKAISDAQGDAFTKHVEATLAAAVVELKEHISAEVVKPTEQIKTHITDQIAANFDKILKNAGIAAQTALADARKTLRMPCEVCGLMSWKFTVNPEGKVICGDCQLKGHK